MTYNFTDQIQRGILYLLKTDEHFYTQISALIKPDYFEFDAYKVIFNSIQSYKSKYGKIPPDNILLEYIRTELKNSKDFEGYEDDIDSINNIDVDSISNNKEFILDAVEKFAKAAAMKEAIKESYLLLQKGDTGGIDEIIRKALMVSRNVDLGQDYFKSVTDRITRNTESKSKDRIPTPFKTANATLEGGLCPKELAIVAAPPGVGKSVYLVNQAAIALKNEKKNVLYVTLEMSEDKVASRFDSVFTHLHIAKLKDPGTQIELVKRLNICEKESGSSKLIIKEFPTGAANVNQIRALLSQLRIYKNFKPDLIVVDYLELLRPNRIIDAEYQAQQRIAEELRGLAVEFNCLVWTATQTNRQARKVAIITDAELGDSYGKIRPADWVISLNQDKEEYDKGHMRVYNIKARDAKQHYLITVGVDYAKLIMEELGCEEQSN